MKKNPPGLAYPEEPIKMISYNMIWKNGGGHDIYHIQPIQYLTS